MNPPKPTLRDILADSHVAAIAIALLLFWSLDCALRAIWAPLVEVASYLFTAVAILDIPYFNPFRVRIMLGGSLSYFFFAVAYFCGAWFVSRWVFGVGPIQILTSYRGRSARRIDA